MEGRFRESRICQKSPPEWSPVDEMKPSLSFFLPFHGWPFVVVPGTLVAPLLSVAALRYRAEDERVVSARLPSAELLHGRERWRAAGPRSYAETVQTTLCECDRRSIPIEVQDGQLVHANAIEDGTSAPIRGHRAPPVV